MSGELLGRNFVAATLIAARRNIGVVLGFAISTFALEVLLFNDCVDAIVGLAIYTLATFVITSYLCVATHATLLQDSSGWESVSNTKTMVMYVTRAFILTATFFAASFAAAILILSEDTERDLLIGTAALLASPISWFVFALMGTMLPAVVVRGNFSLLRTIQRGRKTFFYTLGRLVAGPGLLFIATVLGIGTYKYLINAGDVLSVDQGFEIANAVPSAMSVILNAINVIMFTVIISKAYVLGEEKLVASEQTPAESTT
jgi:hypothetical protein